MVVKSQIKFVKSLQQKKYRNQSGLFVAEGVKLVKELLQGGLIADSVYCTEEDILKDLNIESQRVSDAELKKMSGLKTPNKILGVFKFQESKPLNYSDWILALDDIQDPGNLGTIIRLCDWFGIKHLVCSNNTVDCYNPKTLQATMGSIARVNVFYGSISNVVQESKLPLYGAYMDGENVYDKMFPTSGILLMGNEAHGISKTLQEKITARIGIPQYGKSEIESLNVATATAIMLSELRRVSTQK